MTDDALVEAAAKVLCTVGDSDFRDTPCEKLCFHCVSGARAEIARLRIEAQQEFELTAKEIHTQREENDRLREELRAERVKRLALEVTLQNYDALKELGGE